MANREPKKIERLEVKVMFEPNRIASSCVAKAYERVVPIIRRVVPIANERCRRDRKRRVGGVQ